MANYFWHLPDVWSDKPWYSDWPNHRKEAHAFVLHQKPDIIFIHHNYGDFYCSFLKIVYQKAVLLPYQDIAARTLCFVFLLQSGYSPWLCYKENIQIYLWHLLSKKHEYHNFVRVVVSLKKVIVGKRSLITKIIMQ